MKKIKESVIQERPLDKAMKWIKDAEFNLAMGDRVDAIDSLNMAIKEIRQTLQA